VGCLGGRRGGTGVCVLLLRSAVQPESRQRVGITIFVADALLVSIEPKVFGEPTVGGR